MMTRYEVWMDNQPLSGVDETIWVTDIRESEPKQRIVTAEMALGGLRYQYSARQSLSVSVRFAIREYDTGRRRDVCAQVRKWSRGVCLSTSDRPGQRLFVVCDKLPNVDSAARWTDELEMTFTAYDVPWWESDMATRASYTGASGTASLASLGDSKSLLEASITAQAAVNAMTIAANGHSMTFDGLGMASGDVLTMIHDERGFLSIRKGETSVMDKRTAQSADEIVLAPGPNIITFTADGACHATFTTKGRFE